MHQRTGLKTTTIAVVLTLGVVACGGGDVGSESTDPESADTTAGVVSTAEQSPDTTQLTSEAGVDPGESEFEVCPLLTTDEIESVLESPGPGEEDALLAPLYQCTWVDASERELTLSVAQAPSAAEAEALYEGGSGLEGSEDLSGLGDAARLHPDYFIEGAEIEVLSGDFYVTISITAIDDDRALVPLLEAVLNRLP